MSDPRLTPSNGRVAHVSLRGRVRGERLVEGEERCIVVPVADLWRDAAGGPRLRQLLFGESFVVLEETGERAFGMAGRDGYVGHVARAALGPAVTPSHAVSALSSHVYAAPDVKAPAVMALSHGSRLRVAAAAGGFARIGTGRFVPLAHLRPLDAPPDDPAAVAELLRGVPYLWGGNSTWGIDCSGLVQAALLACAIPCPGDSDQQEATLGRRLGDDAPLHRGDLVFWRGHVAMVLDGDRMIHANAHNMAVTVEPLAARALVWIVPSSD